MWKYFENVKTLKYVTFSEEWSILDDMVPNMVAEYCTRITKLWKVNFIISYTLFEYVTHLLIADKFYGECTHTHTHTHTLKMEVGILSNNRLSQGKNQLSHDLICQNFFLSLFLRERETECKHGRGRERETEYETGCRLHHVSTEPDVGLKPMNQKIMA